MYLKLRIFDFDQTITQQHTYKDRSLLAENNIKTGVKEQFLHDDQNLCAIATFHEDPQYVLTYLLYLLNLNQEDVSKEETKLVEPDHQLLILSLKGKKHPLIIASPQTKADDREFYKSKIKKFTAENSKNKMLESLIAALPVCSHYSYYEDSLNLYNAARCLDKFHCFRIEAENTEFTVLQQEKLLPLNHLKNLLRAFLAPTPQEENTTKPSFFSCRIATSSTYRAQTENPEQESAQFLLNFLNDDKQIDLAGIDVSLLNKELIDMWQQETGKEHDLEHFLIELVHIRESRLDDHDSGDERQSSLGLN